MLAKLPDLHSQVLLFDGGMGSMLHQKGALAPGTAPELLNTTNPEVVLEIHRAYLAAGAGCLESNTFGANRVKLEAFGLADKARQLNTAGIRIAKQAAGDKFLVAGSLGPTGKILEPLGDLSFEAVYKTYLEQCRSFAEAQADLVTVETMSDLREVKAAILAALEVNLPVIASVSFMENGRLLTGATPEMVAATLSGFPLFALGTNCGLTAAALQPIAQKLIAYSKHPVIVQPNAGKPVLTGSQTVYQESAVEFATALLESVKEGARIVGGCCGTTPEHIRELSRLIQNTEISYCQKAEKNYLVGKNTIIPVEDSTFSANVHRIEIKAGNPLWDEFLSGNSDYLVDTIFDIDASRYPVIELDGSALSAVDAESLKKMIQVLVTYWPNPVNARLNHSELITAFLQNNPGRSIVKINSNSEKLMQAILINGGIPQRIG